MKIPAILLICALVTSCGTPEPRIVTREVKVSVPVPCKPKLGPRPYLLTKDQMKAALAAAPTLDDKIKAVTEQLLLYMGWTPIVEAGLTGCEGGAQ